MISLRLTKRLCNAVEATPILDPSEPTNALGDWYGNLIPTAHGGLIVFVNERSLLTVCIPLFEDLIVSHLAAHFYKRVERMLYFLEIPEKARDRELAEMKDILIAKTKSRKVIGVMNEICFDCQDLILQEGPEAFSNLSSIETKISEVSHRNLALRRAADVARELLLEPRKGKQIIQ